MYTHTYTLEKNMEEYQDTHQILILVFFREIGLEVEGETNHYFFIYLCIV